MSKITAVLIFFVTLGIGILAVQARDWLFIHLIDERAGSGMSHANPDTSKYYEACDDQDPVKITRDRDVFGKHHDYVAVFTITNSGFRPIDYFVDRYRNVAQQRILTSPTFFDEKELGPGKQIVYSTTTWDAASITVYINYRTKLSRSIQFKGAQFLPGLSTPELCHYAVTNITSFNK